MHHSDIHLVLFCRRPAPGVGKQRLAAAIGSVPAATAAQLLLATALEDASQWPGPVVLAPAHRGDGAWAKALLARPCTVITQPEGTLGERINGVDRQLRATGARRIIYIGSDAPGLDSDYYAAARAALDQADVVLGPALDGGVTLMGAVTAWPDLAGLPWSTDRLGTELAAVCDAQGSRVTQLEARADIDLAGDLDRESDALRADRRPARRRLVEWWRREGRRAVGT
jgi:rSAM/selenodomain-associated transferase 1